MWFWFCFVLFFVGLKNWNNLYLLRSGFFVDFRWPSRIDFRGPLWIDISQTPPCPALSYPNLRRHQQTDAGVRNGLALNTNLLLLLNSQSICSVTTINCVFIFYFPFFGCSSSTAICLFIYLLFSCFLIYLFIFCYFSMNFLFIHCVFVFLGDWNFFLLIFSRFFEISIYLFFSSGNISIRFWLIDTCPSRSVRKFPDCLIYFHLFSIHFYFIWFKL